MKPDSSFEAKVLAAFTASVLVVAVLSAMTWKSADDATHAVQRVAHTHDVLNQIAHTRSDTLRIELMTQSFRVFGDTAHLVERDATIAHREEVLARLAVLTADNAEQKDRWQRLRTVLNERLQISQQVELLRKTQGQSAAAAFVATAPLRETRERTYRVLHEMEEEETGLLAQRNAEQARTHQTMIAFGLLVALLLAVLLTATYVLIRRQLQTIWASQQALAQSEESLSTTLHSIGDAVLATDVEGRITRMNPVAERLTGWPLDEARGRPIEEVFCIVNEQTRIPAVIPVAQVLATGQMQDLANHTSLISRDGRECPIADSAAPIRNVAGELTGVVLVFRDETVVRQAQRTIREQNEQLEQRVRERTAQLHESEAHLHSVISSVPALIAYVDAQQHYVYVNRQYQERFAPEQPDIAGCTVREILGPDRYAIAAPLIHQVLQGEAQSYDWQPFPGIWQVINYLPKHDPVAGVVGYYVLGTDITERKNAEEKIKALNIALEQHVQQLEHVSRALKTLSAGNRAMLRATNEQSLLDNMCQSIVEVGGYHMAIVWYCQDDDVQSLQPMAQSGFAGGLAELRQLQLSWADNERGQGAAAIAIRTDKPVVIGNVHSHPGCVQLQSYLHDKASALACPLHIGAKVIGAMSIYHTDPDIFGADEVALLSESADDLAFGIATLRVSAEQQKNQEEVNRLMRYDALTGLPNATQFTECLTAAIATGQHSGQPFAVLQTNIERLSEINDALGFHHGDQMLREFGLRLRAAAPAAAVVARLRGDEFAVLLPNSDTAIAVATVESLQQAMAQPFPLADIFLDVSAKTGVALFPAHGSTTHDLYRHMDIALHQAKKKEEDYVVFDVSQNRVRSSHLSLAGELRRAIEGGHLSLYLQPKVEMTTGRVCGAEGLVRWNHAERGLVMPSEFIGLSEHTGLIKPLTEWVIETSLQLNRAWARDGHSLPIAVNLSARNLRDVHLLEKILHLQTLSGVATGLLELEITESTVMEDAEFALRVLHGLRDAGIALYIDDFGTGYSSLSYLQKLPVEYIKIDQSFVRDMSVNKDSALIVRSTIDLAHDLGRKVVAEGVETQQHWEQLAAFGCDLAQGYWIAKPMPAEQFQGWLEQFQPPSGYQREWCI